MVWEPGTLPGPLIRVFAGSRRNSTADIGRFRAVAFRLAYLMLACVLTRLMLLAQADAVNDVEILVLGTRSPYCSDTIRAGG